MSAETGRPTNATICAQLRSTKARKKQTTIPLTATAANTHCAIAIEATIIATTAVVPPIMTALSKKRGQVNLLNCFSGS